MLTIFSYFKKRDWGCAAICLGLIVISVWLDLTMPDYTQKLSESVSTGSIALSEVWKNGGMMLLCALGSACAAMICGFFASRIAANFARTLRHELFGRIMQFSNAEISKFSTPSLITRTTNDVVQQQMLIAMGMQVILKAPILAVWALMKISNTSVEWTAAVFICVAAMVVTITILVVMVYPRFKQIQKLTDDLNNVTRENITGVRVVRAFNAEDYQAKKFRMVNDAITRNHLFTARSMGLMMPMMQIAMNGLTLAIYWIGAYLINEAEVIQRAEVIGSMTAFTQYALQVVMAFIMLVAIFIILPRTMVSARRIAQVLETDSSVSYPDTPIAETEHGTVEFRNVAFSYQDSGEQCLKHISFRIEKGQTFAIIGATGTGKSTLVNLIPRFYDATAGQIFINGKDIRNYPEEQLCAMISVAPQKAQLFGGTIKSNITYGAKEVPDDDPGIRRALAIAHADFVNQLEQGIHAEVAQGGTNLSGGQKQRLSIARAIYKNAPIMIFDDTFSALDYKTDMLVRKSLSEELADTTVIIVAQRIGTIRNADAILVLHNGEIAGLGKHEELLETCPIYQEIALSQLSAEELSGKENA